jgi:hypothetical protein
MSENDLRWLSNNLMLAARVESIYLSVARKAETNGVDLEPLKAAALKSQAAAGVWSILEPMIESAKKPPEPAEGA